MKPRIYTYKITFEEVSYYYYGVHKERYFNQEYWGTPITNKWCWDLYTPKKQILELFDYSDEGWIEAHKVEDRIIRPFLNDKLCLNENVGGTYSLKIRRETGLKHKENGTGIFALTKEQRSENSTKIGIKHRENRTGFFSLTPKQKSELGRKNGLQHKENGTSIFALTKEQRVENGRKTTSQKWQCLETGFIANPGNLSKYQKRRGIDTRRRKRIA